MIIKATIKAVSIAVFLSLAFVCRDAAAVYTNGQNASNVLGQTYVNGSISYTSATVNNPMNVGVQAPMGVAIDSVRHKAYVVDSANNRILIFLLNNDDTFPDYGADYIMGQIDFAQTKPNRNTARPLANSLKNPSRVFVYEPTGDVYVSDTGNNRVLIFNTVDSMDPSAKNVLGANNFTTDNASGVVSQSLMLSPDGITASGSGVDFRLFISDRSFNRVLVFGEITNDGQAAMSVLGQADFITSSASLSQANLASPAGLTSDGTNLYVADTNNNRIMIWPVTATTGQNAVKVLGQTWFFSNSAGTSNTAMNKPQSIDYGNNGYLYVADTNNNRVMVWSTQIVVSAQSANYVVGQTSFTSSAGGVSPSKLLDPVGVNASGGMLLVADSKNNRIAVFPMDISGNGQSANFVLGQLATGNVVDFYGDTLNNPQDKGVNAPSGIAIDSVQHRLFVSDTNNNRVLVYYLSATNSLTDYTADLVIGQASSSVTAPNRGGVASALTLNGPTGLFYDQVRQRLYISDTGNNRVLIYTSAIYADGQAANIVLGQGDFVTTNAAATRALFSAPEGVTVNPSSGAVAVVDRGNNRVLLWNSAPTANGQQANYVLGQSTFTSSSFGTTSRALRTPRSASFNGINGALLVADSGNNRIMIWTSSISANNQAANRVLGQPNMTTSLAEPVNETTLKQPTFVHVSTTSGVVYVADSGNNRALVYKDQITSDGQAANIVIGQPSMTANDAAVTQSSLSSPAALVTDNISGYVYVVDSGNNRVLSYSNTGPVAPSLTVPTDGAENTISTPTFQLVGADPDGDSLKFSIQIARDAGFTVGLQTYDQTQSAVGWTGQDAGDSYKAGTPGTYTLQGANALSATTTYYWRAASYDAYGSKVWGAWSATSSFTTAPASSIAFTSTYQTVVAGQNSIQIMFGLRDANGNIVRSSTATRLYLKSSSATGEFSAQASPFVQISYIDLPAGVSSIGVYYRDTVVGNPTITASDADPADGDVGLDDATYSIGIESAQLYSFSLSTINNQTAGTPFDLGITARDRFGNVVTGFNQAITLTATLGTISTPQATLNTGFWSGSVTLTTAGTTAIAATHQTTVSTSNQFTVVPAPLHHVSMVPPAEITVKAGSGTSLAVEAYDQYDNRITTGVTYNWLVNPALGTLNSLSQPTVSFTAADTVISDIVQVTVTEATTLSASVRINVIPDRFEMTAMPANVTAGSAVPVSVVARSQNGNIVSGAAYTTSLSDTSGFMAPLSVQLVGGVWSGSLTFTLSQSGNIVNLVSLQDNITGSSNSFNVIPAALDHVVVSPLAVNQPVESTSTISAQGFDRFNNAIGSVTYNWTTTVGSIGSSGQTVTLTAGSIAGAGTLQVTATEGAVTRTVTIPVTLTPLVLDRFVIDPILINVPTAGDIFNIRIVAKDRNDNTITSFNGNGSLAFSGGLITPSATTDFINGVWTGSVRVNKAMADAVISFSNGGKIGTSNLFNVRPNKLSVVTINPSELSLSTNEVRAIDAKAYDAYSNEITMGVTYTWSVSNPLILSVSPLDTQMPNAMATTRAGQSFINVTAREGAVGVSNTMLATVNPDVVSQFKFDTISSPKPAQELFSLRISAHDQYGNLVTNYNGSALLSDLSGSLSPTQTTGFVNGVWQGFVQINNVYNTDSITAASGLVSATSNEFDVTSNLLDRVVVTPSSSSVVAGQTQEFSAQGYDMFGNAIVGLIYDWSVIGAAGAVSPVAGVATTFTASTSTGAGFVRVRATQGNITKQVDAPVTVIAGTLDRFTVSTIPEVEAGVPVNVTIRARDVYGNTATQFTGSVSLSDDLGGVVPATTDPFTQGIWTGQIAFEKSGLNKLKVGYGAVISNSDQFTVHPTFLYEATINMDPVIVTVGKTQPLIAYGKDRFGNIIEDISYTWSIPKSLGTISSQNEKEITLTAAQIATKAAISLTIAKGPTIVSRTFDVTLVADELMQFIMSPINSPQIAGTPFQVTAKATDQYGNTVLSYNQPVMIGDTTNTISPTQSENFRDGYWSGPVTITLSGQDLNVILSSGSVQSVSNPFEVKAGEQQVFLKAFSGAGQTGKAGSKLDEPLAIRAVDLYGNYLPGIAIKYSIDSVPIDATGSTMTPDLVQTDSEGIARSEFIVGNKSGSYIINAHIDGRSSAGITFYINAESAQATSVKVSPSMTTLLVNSSQTYSAEAFDSFGNAIPNAQIKWNVVNGGGVISDEGVFTAGSTTRVFRDTISASIDGVAGFASVTITTLPGITDDNREGAGELDRLFLAPLEPSIETSRSMAFSVRAVDRYNQEVNPTELSYAWKSTGGEVELANSSQTTFTAGDTPSSGTVEVTVTQGSKLITKSTKTSVMITPNPLGYIKVKPAQNKIVSGEEFDVQIVAYKGNGDIDDKFTGPIELSDSTSSITPRLSGSFVKGVWAGKIKINTSNAMTVVRAAGQERYGVSGNIQVDKKFNMAQISSDNILSYAYNAVVAAGESIAGFVNSLFSVSASYPETTRNIAASAVASLGFIAAAIGFGKVASTAVVSIGRNPYARRKIFLTLAIALIVGLVFAGLAFLIAGFIKFI